MPYNTPEKKKIHNQKYYKKWYSKFGRARRSLVSYGSAKKWIKSHGKEVKAHQLLNKAIRVGVISKPDKCSQCKRKTRLHGHHKDYSKPLSVLWLCASCHKLLHYS